MKRKVMLALVLAVLAVAAFGTVAFADFCGGVPRWVVMCTH